MNFGADAEERPGAKRVPALVKAAQILDLLTREARPLRGAEIARALGLSKSTVHVLCSTLLDLELLARVGGAHFAIGPHALSWAGAFQSQSDLTTEFNRVWDALNVLPEETVTLSILSGIDVVYIGCRNGSRPIGVSFRAGMRLPAPYTATGKAILSTFDEGDLRRLFADGWPPSLTRASVRDLDALITELAEVRVRGFSIDHGQSREGASCFGAPVFTSPAGPAVAGVAVALLTASASDAAIAETGDAVRRLASRLSRRLGAQAAPENPGTGRLVANSRP